MGRSNDVQRLPNCKIAIRDVGAFVSDEHQSAARRDAGEDIKLVGAEIGRTERRRGRQALKPERGQHHGLDTLFELRVGEAMPITVDSVRQVMQPGFPSM